MYGIKLLLLTVRNIVTCYYHAIPMEIMFQKYKNNELFTVYQAVKSTF